MMRIELEVRGGGVCFGGVNFVSQISGSGCVFTTEALGAEIVVRFLICQRVFVNGSPRIDSDAEYVGVSARGNGWRFLLFDPLQSLAGNSLGNAVLRTRS